MKPQKSDIVSIMDLPDVITTSEINVHIEDAYKFDVRPRLSTLATDIYAYTPEVPTPAKPQLVAFYTNFVLEWWVRLAYYRFYEVHGLNVTQFGVTKIKDPQGTFDQAQGIEKAIRLKRLRTDAETLYTLLLNETWAFDGSAYRKPNACGSNNDGASWGINSIG